MQEGVDYYLDENGLMVFTAAYHLKRGYCCESGCRHCPYPKNAPGATITKIDAATYAGLDFPVLSEDTQIIRREGWYQAFSPLSNEASDNEVKLSLLKDSEVDQTIEDTLSLYKQHGLQLKWAIGPMSSPDRLEAELAKRASVSWDFRGMAIDTISDTINTSVQLPQARKLSTERVTSSNLEEFLGVHALGWEMQPLSPATRRKLERTVSHPLCQNFLARIGGQAVGCAGTILKEGYGYLVGAVVLKAFRGSGAYRALIQARLAELKNLGIPFAVTQAREATSAPILEQLGFETVFRAKIFRFDP